SLPFAGAVWVCCARAGKAAKPHSSRSRVAARRWFRTFRSLPPMKPLKGLEKTAPFYRELARRGTAIAVFPEGVFREVAGPRRVTRVFHREVRGSWPEYRGAR